MELGAKSPKRFPLLIPMLEAIGERHSISTEFSLAGRSN